MKAKIAMSSFGPTACPMFSVQNCLVYENQRHEKLILVLVRGTEQDVTVLTCGGSVGHLLDSEIDRS